MTACCTRKLPDGLQYWEINKSCTVQRKKTTADGASENTHGEIDYTSDSNWVTFTPAMFAFKTKMGRQVDMMGNIVDVNQAKAYCIWTSVTGSITASHRILYGTRVYQITSAINWNELNELMVLGVAEIEVDH